MTFHFFVTILSNIVNFIVILDDLLLLMVVDMLPQVLQSIHSTHWVLKDLLISVLVGAARGQNRLVGEDLSAQAGCRPLWIGSTLQNFFPGGSWKSLHVY